MLPRSSQNFLCRVVSKPRVFTSRAKDLTFVVKPFVEKLSRPNIRPTLGNGFRIVWFEMVPIHSEIPDEDRINPAIRRPRTTLHARH